MLRLLRYLGQLLYRVFSIYRILVCNSSIKLRKAKVSSNTPKLS